MSIVELLKKNDATIRKNFHVRKIGVFGSFARSEEKAESDVDVLVEFEEGYKTFDNFIELKYFLEELFARSVDLVTVSALKPQLKEDILQEVVYA